MAEIFKTGQFRPSAPMMWLFGTSVLMGFVYMFALGVPLLGPDEPRYAQVAREMFERGDLVTTTLGDRNWFEKPVLLYWLQIAAYSVFGVSEFSARLGSALSGLGTVLSLLFLGAGATRRDVKGETPLAYWLLAVGATSLGLLVFSRGASFDIIVTFPLTAAMTAFFLWFRAAEQGSGARQRTALLFAFYFFAGVATLAKGLIGIVFPAAIVAFFYVLRRKFFPRELLLSLLWGPIVSLAVASSWYLPMYLRNGWEFIDEFFIQHHFQRFTSNKYKHPQPFWFFWAIFPLMTIPWIPFFFAALWKYGKDLAADIASAFKVKGAGAAAPNDLAVFSFAWMLVPLVFFSFSGSKLPGYVLPSLPPAAVLTALYVNGFAAGSKVREMTCKGLTFAMFGVIVFLLAFIVPGYADNDSAKSLVRAADDRGYANAKVLNFRAVNHSLEFYAPGRLVRDDEGRQIVFESLEQLRKDLPEGGALVVTHGWDIDKLTADGDIRAEELSRRGEWAILAVGRTAPPGDSK